MLSTKSGGGGEKNIKNYLTLLEWRNNAKLTKKQGLTNRSRSIFFVRFIVGNTAIFDFIKVWRRKNLCSVDDDN